MAVSDSVRSVMSEKGATHQELADVLNYERSYVTKIVAGDRPWPETADSKLAKWSYKLALKLADERTGGFISNILDDLPDMDTHPAALKEQLLKDLHEAISALERFHTSKHICSDRRQKSAESVWHECLDVEQKSAVLRGVLEEEFELDRDRLNREHDHQVRNGER